jgi:hypothetical protein
MAPVAVISGRGTLSAGDWLASARLPYRNGWLDVPATLSRLTQQDRLPSTSRDDEKCSAMVATAAALAGGRGRFEKVLSIVETKRRGDLRDRRALEVVRSHFEANGLTAGDLQKFADAFYRAYLKGDGATDGEISRMIRASGLSGVPTGARRPTEMLPGLRPGECFPMNLQVDGVWHVTLVWKDSSGVARLYDSDRLRGTQVFREGSPAFERYMNAPTAETPLRQKFR